MTQDMQQTYELIWSRENNFSYEVARRVLDKPKISVWIILVPILFLYYAHKIQQYKAGIKDFGKGLARSKIVALDSAAEEVKTGKKDESFKEALATAQHTAPNALRVRDKQIAEVELLKTHYDRLLCVRAASYRDLIRQVYGTKADYRHFLEELAAIEKEVQEAVLHAYHPDDEARRIAHNMRTAMRVVREEEMATLF
jgi:hypothetical protein